MTRRYHRVGAAVVLPVRVKPTLMGLPWPIWKRLVYPLWLRWYERSLRSRRWKAGLYRPGETARWRGVRLVCCTQHYVGDQAQHPWDPGWGWPTWKANALWEPARRGDRRLLRLVGDPRSAPVLTDPDLADRETGPEPLAAESSNPNHEPGR